jgi:hypothetical protein
MYKIAVPLYMELVRVHRGSNRELKIKIIEEIYGDKKPFILILYLKKLTKLMTNTFFVIHLPT